VTEGFLAATKLSHLNLCANALSGSLPKVFFEMKSLGKLSLGLNKYVGTIPKKITELEKLWHLDLHHNYLEGGLHDSSLRKLHRLADLVLNGNPLGGSLPKNLGLLVNLRSVHLQSCALTGSISDAFGTMRNLRLLHLQQNFLQGMLPEGLLQHPGLQYLSLAANELEGSIPAVIERMQSLVELNLGQNHFSGSIPKGIEQLQRLTVLFVASNRLEGIVPKALSGLSSLHNVSFANNVLEGIVPSDVRKVFLRVNPQAFAGNTFDGSSFVGQVNRLMGPVVTCIIVFAVAVLEFGIPLGPIRWLFSKKTFTLIVILLYGWCIYQLVTETEDHMEAHLSALLLPLLHCILSAEVAGWLRTCRRSCANKRKAAVETAVPLAQATDASRAESIHASELIKDLAGRGMQPLDILDFVGKLGLEVDGCMAQYDPRVSTTFDVVHQAIVPTTRSNAGGSSYARMVSGTTDRMPNRMVVHCWGALFHELVACVLADALQETSLSKLATQLGSKRQASQLKARLQGSSLAYFIDVFSINQHTCACHDFGSSPGALLDSTGVKLVPCSCGQSKSREAENSEPRSWHLLLRHLHRSVPRQALTQVVLVDTDLQVFGRTWCVAEILLARQLAVRQNIIIAGSSSEAKASIEYFDLASCKVSYEADAGYLRTLVGSFDDCRGELLRAVEQTPATGASVKGPGRSKLGSALNDLFSELSGAVLMLAATVAAVAALDYGTKWSV